MLRNNGYHGTEWPVHRIIQIGVTLFFPLKIVVVVRRVRFSVGDGELSEEGEEKSVLTAHKATMLLFKFQA